MKETITAHVECVDRERGYWKGYVKVGRGNGTLYTEYCYATRTSKLDAKSDALRAVAELKELNGVK